MVGPSGRQLWIKRFNSNGPSHGVVIIRTGSGEIRSVDDDGSDDLASWLVQLGWDAVVYDKFGCGESEGDWKYVTFDDLGDDLAILSDYFKWQCLGKVVILGQSESSILAAEAATKTDSIDALILRVASHQDISQRIKMQLGAERWNKWLEDLEDAKKNRRKFVASHPVSYWQSRINRTLTGDLISDIEIPILALNGLKDKLTPPSAFEKIHNAVLNKTGDLSTAVALSGVGHSLMLPSETWHSSKVANKIQLFLSKIATL